MDRKTKMNASQVFVNPFKNKNIGRRTGKDIKAGKNIRTFADGFENFDDYWSESDMSSVDVTVDHGIKGKENELQKTAKNKFVPDPSPQTMSPFSSGGVGSSVVKQPRRLNLPEGVDQGGDVSGSITKDKTNTDEPNSAMQPFRTKKRLTYSEKELARRAANEPDEDCNVTLTESTDNHERSSAVPAVEINTENTQKLSPKGTVQALDDDVNHQAKEQLKSSASVLEPKLTRGRRKQQIETQTKDAQPVTIVQPSQESDTNNAQKVSSVLKPKLTRSQQRKIMEVNEGQLVNENKNSDRADLETTEPLKPKTTRGQRKTPKMNGQNLSAKRTVPGDVDKEKSMLSSGLRRSQRKKSNADNTVQQVVELRPKRTGGRKQNIVEEQQGEVDMNISSSQGSQAIDKTAGRKSSVSFHQVNGQVDEMCESSQETVEPASSQESQAPATESLPSSQASEGEEPQENQVWVSSHESQASVKTVSSQSSQETEDSDNAVTSIHDDGLEDVDDDDENEDDNEEDSKDGSGIENNEGHKTGRTVETETYVPETQESQTDDSANEEVLPTQVIPETQNTDSENSAEEEPVTENLTEKVVIQQMKRPQVSSKSGIESLFSFRQTQSTGGTFLSLSRNPSKIVAEHENSEEEDYEVIDEIPTVYTTKQKSTKVVKQRGNVSRKRSNSGVDHVEKKAVPQSKQKTKSINSAKRNLSSNFDSDLQPNETELSDSVFEDKADQNLPQEPEVKNTKRKSTYDVKANLTQTLNVDSEEPEPKKASRNTRKNSKAKKVDNKQSLNRIEQCIEDLSHNRSSDMVHTSAAKTPGVEVLEEEGILTEEIGRKSGKTLRRKTIITDKESEQMTPDDEPVVKRKSGGKRKLLSLCPSILETTEDVDDTAEIADPSRGVVEKSHLNDAAQNLPKNKKQAGTKSRTKNDENSTERNKQTTVKKGRGRAKRKGSRILKKDRFTTRKSRSKSPSNDKRNSTGEDSAQKEMNDSIGKGNGNSTERWKSRLSTDQKDLQSSSATLAENEISPRPDENEHYNDDDAGDDGGFSIPSPPTVRKHPRVAKLVYQEESPYLSQASQTPNARPSSATPKSILKKTSQVSHAPHGRRASFVSPPNSATHSVVNRRRTASDMTAYYSGGDPQHFYEVTTTDTPSPLEKPKKKVVKIIAPEPAPEGVRRSNRTRIAPLEWYKLERPKYKRKSGGFLVDGVIPPVLEEEETKPNVPKKKRKVSHRKLAQTPRNMTIHTDIPSDCELGEDGDIPVINPETNQEVYLECVKVKDAFLFRGPTGQEPAENDDLLICKTIQQKAFSVGQVILRPLCEKPTQFVRNDTMIFHILRGKLSVTIHRTTSILESGDVFFIPAGNTYSLKNLREDEAKLLFYQHKG